jgi:hypothetical protein
MAMIAAAALAVSLLGAAPGAFAATTYGSECQGDLAFMGPTTALESLGPAKGMPVSGVITAWKMKGTSFTVMSTQRLKVARRAGGSEPVITAETAPVVIGIAEKGVATRLPVQAGDLIGLSSQDETGYTDLCSAGGATNGVSAVKGDVTVGETAAVGSATTGQALPVRVTIEPDADGDGFGDETQDACPTSALVQTACPILAPPPATTPPPSPHPLAVAAAHRGSATVRVTSDLPATVAVKGRVELGGGAKVTPSAGSKALAAGQAASFTLKFPKALKQKLAALPTKSKLKLQITVTATSPAGPVGTAALTVRLHGQG